MKHRAKTVGTQWSGGSHFREPSTTCWGVELRIDGIALRADIGYELEAEKATEKVNVILRRN